VDLPEPSAPTPPPAPAPAPGPTTGPATVAEPGSQPVTRPAPVVAPQPKPQGIGVRFEKRPKDLRIIEVFSGSAAERAGLTRGDMILEIDGTDVTELSLRGAVQRIVGPVGTRVVLRVRYASGDIRSISVVRGSASQPSGKSTGLDSTLPALCRSKPSRCSRTPPPTPTAPSSAQPWKPGST
jgi:membrane-associated protease RseP (regulator of RpoE activity)